MSHAWFTITITKCNKVGDWWLKVFFCFSFKLLVVLLRVARAIFRCFMHVLCVNLRTPCVICIRNVCASANESKFSFSCRSEVWLVALLAGGPRLVCWVGHTRDTDPRVLACARAFFLFCLHSFFSVPVSERMWPDFSPPNQKIRQNSKVYLCQYSAVARVGWGGSKMSYKLVGRRRHGITQFTSFFQGNSIWLPPTHHKMKPFVVSYGAKEGASSAKFGFSLEL